MVFNEISYESPLIFLMLQGYFQDKNYKVLEEKAIKAGATKDEFEKFKAYAAGFYANMGNYNSHGGKKIVPEISEKVFKKILLSNPRASKEGDIYSKVIQETYPKVQKEIFAVEKPYSTLGFPKEGGVTGYFGRNMDKNDLKLVE